MMLLTDEERRKFAEWLEQDAASCRAIADQLEKLGPMHHAMANKERIDAIAEMLIAKKLRNTESFEVTP